MVDAFQQGMRELGWSEGQSLVVEYRWAEGQFDRLPDLAAELVRLKVEVILVGSMVAAVAARKATDIIPIVVATGANLEGLGLVTSFARPGGNVTGLAYDVGLLTISKQLELLKETIPKLRRVAILSNPNNPASSLSRSLLREAGWALELELQLLEARGPEEFNRAFAAMAQDRAGALVLLTDPVFTAHRARLRDLAATGRLPAIYGLREYADAGGLMSYGPNLRDNFRRAATYVDKILKGAKPADLPVEQPLKFELVINSKTARTLRLAIPPSVLLRWSAPHFVCSPRGRKMPREAEWANTDGRQTVGGCSAPSSSGRPFSGS
jgi:putative ABC transport system substrate-binding protein